jgi:hypothetical protein
MGSLPNSATNTNSEMVNTTAAMVCRAPISRREDSQPANQIQTARETEELTRISDMCVVPNECNCSLQLAVFRRGCLHLLTPRLRCSARRRGRKWATFTRDSTGILGRIKWPHLPNHSTQHNITSYEITFNWFVQYPGRYCCLFKASGILSSPTSTVMAHGLIECDPPWATLGLLPLVTSCIVHHGNLKDQSSAAECRVPAMKTIISPSQRRPSLSSPPDHP